MFGEHSIKTIETSRFQKTTEAFCEIVMVKIYVLSRYHLGLGLKATEKREILRMNTLLVLGFPLDQLI